MTVSGVLHVCNVHKECGVADKVPSDHSHPSMVVDLGLMIVCEGDSLRSFLEAAFNTCSQFTHSSSRVFPPQNKLSAIFTAWSACIREPNTRHTTSSSAVSDPGMPIAAVKYTLVPLKGVDTPQYFIDAESRGI